MQLTFKLAWKNLISGSLVGQTFSCFINLFVAQSSYGKLSAFGVEIIFLKAVFVEWLTEWKNTNCVSVKKIWVFSLATSSVWANNSVTGMLEHVNKSTVSWIQEVIIWPTPCAGQIRVQCTMWFRARLKGTAARGACDVGSGWGGRESAESSWGTVDRLTGATTAVLKYLRCCEVAREVGLFPRLESIELRQMVWSWREADFGST